MIINEEQDNHSSENNDDDIVNTGLNNSEDSSDDSRVFEYFSDSKEDFKPKVKDELLIFYEATKIDSELTEIKQEKGDLPQDIENLREKVKQLELRQYDYKKDLKQFEKDDKDLIKMNKTFEERINKLDEKKYSAKSNKEYDNITKAIDAAFEEVEKNEKRLKSLIGDRITVQKNLDESTEKLKELKSDLEDKEKALNDLNQEFEDEESELRAKREEQLSKLSEDHRKLYEKINKVYNGEATAIVRKDNCTGCYNSIPPQKVIEIKTAKKIFTCHSCGRILISEEFISENS
jgi:uncharacterized protein